MLSSTFNGKPVTHSQTKRGVSFALHFSRKAHQTSVLTNAILVIVLHFLVTFKTLAWPQRGIGSQTRSRAE